MKKIKTGVIGVGRLGSLHAKIYNQMPDVELTGIYDIDKEKCKKIANLYNTKAFPDYKRLIESVDAVSIATPTSKHFEIAKESIKSNVHSLIEKPVTSNIKQAQQLINLSKKTKSIIQVGHVERFNAAVKALCQMSGIPRFIECHRLSPYTYRGTDVSVTMDLMIHDINIISTLVKSKVKKIEAVGIAILSNSNDITNARITFENNTVANLTSSRVSKESMRKIRIFQKHTYISLDYIKQKAEIYKKQKNKIVKNEMPIEKKEPLKAELESFINCIKENKTPLVSIKEATYALRIASKIDNIIKKNHSKFS